MSRGFTLIELMIVIAILAIIAAIAIPNLIESRLTANEGTAAASLRGGLLPAQVQFQGGGHQDADSDGVGEYGTLQALSGLIATNRTPVQALRLLTGTFRDTAAYSSAVPVANPTAGPITRFLFVKVAGYCFTCWAPSGTADGSVTTQLWVEGGAAPLAPGGVGAVTCNNGEQIWAAIAIPEKYSHTGRRAFLICQDGQVRCPTIPAAAFLPFGAITSPTAGLPPTLSGMSSFLATGFDPAYPGTPPAAVVPAALTALDTSQARFEVYGK